MYIIKTMKEFGGRLKELRKEKGLDQTQLASKLNLGNQATVSRWESGNFEPDIKTLIKLADFFDVTLDYLVGRSDY